MKTSYVIPGVPPELCADRSEVITAALSKVTKQKIGRAREQFNRGRPGFTPGQQPRDSTGRFRKILARLKFDLGDTELDEIVAEIKTAEQNIDTGNLGKAAKAGDNVIKLVDDIKEGLLSESKVKNIRAGAAELGRVLAYLPIPQGEDNAKVRFSDLPKQTRDLVDSMIERVVEKLGSDEAGPLIALLQSYKSGVRSMTSDELLGELNKLLRLLT